MRWRWLRAPRYRWFRYSGVPPPRFDDIWKLVLIESFSKYGETGRGGMLQIPLDKLKFPAKSEDVWEVYPRISLVPHDCGILNRDMEPRHEKDMERLIRVVGK